MSPYPISYDEDDHKTSGGAVYPLKLMREYIDNGDISFDIDLKSKHKATIILSIGGNDGRIHLNKLTSITGGASDVIKALKNDNFITNYKQIVDKLVNDFNCNVILIFVYQIQHQSSKYISFCV